MQAEDDAETSSKRHKQAPIDNAIKGPINLFLEEASSSDGLTSVRRVAYYPEEPRISWQWLNRFQNWAAPEFWDLPRVAARCTHKPRRLAFAASPTTNAALLAFEHLLRCGLGDYLPYLLPPGIHRLVVDYLSVEIRALARRSVVNNGSASLQIISMEDYSDRVDYKPLVAESVWVYGVWRGKLETRESILFF